MTIEDVDYEKNDEIKDAYPKKVCHMPTRHVRKKKKGEKDSQHPRKERDGS